MITLDKIKQNPHPITRVHKLIQEINNRDTFIEAVRNALGLAISLLENKKADYYNMDEGGYSSTLDSNLICLGLNSARESSNNGSVDLTITHYSYKFLIECKLHNGYITSKKEAYLQLTTRYSSALDFDTGAIIMYNKDTQTDKKSKDDLTRLKKDFPNLKVESDTPHKPTRTYFETSTIEEASGATYYVLHLYASLYHKPKDKSGRSAKKYK